MAGCMHVIGCAFDVVLACVSNKARAVDKHDRALVPGARDAQGNGRGGNRAAARRLARYASLATGKVWLPACVWSG
jgi:hypothetical protein